MTATGRTALGLNAAGIGLLTLEALIGPTILGNVILLLGAFAVGIAAVVCALLHLRERATLLALVLLITSLGVTGYPVSRFVSDSVPVGYGP